MIGKDFESIGKADIDALVANGVAEAGNCLDYKEHLPRSSDESTKEFLADVSSFANASGGELIFGVREKEGVAEAADGLAGCNADAEILRLSNVILSGLDPRVPGIRLKALPGFPAGPVIICRIPKSWAGPHMVKFKNSSRFFSRTSASKYQLDVREIRASFLASDNLGNKLAAFRADRVSKILAGETPVRLKPTPKLVLHIMPVQSFSESPVLDMRTASALWWEKGNELLPMGQIRNWTPPEFNFDGLFACGGGPSDFRSPESYLQLFRHGALEAVATEIHFGPCVLGSVFEEALIKATPRYLQFQTRLALAPGSFVAASILSARGLLIVRTDRPVREWRPLPLDRDPLLAPEVFVEDKDADIGRVLRPALDTIWQASGWPGSQGYDESGKWVGYQSFLRR